MRRILGSYSSSTLKKKFNYICLRKTMIKQFKKKMLSQNQKKRNHESREINDFQIEIEVVSSLNFFFVVATHFLLK